MRLPVILASAALLVPVSGSAQDSAGWGVSATVAPYWSTPSSLGVGAGTVDMHGSDVTIGVVRGRELGGDWGVSFVRKRIADGSHADDLTRPCFGAACFLDGESRVYHDTALTGVEMHKYVNFVTVRRRFQIGMNLAGGVAAVSGTQVKTVYSADFVGSTVSGNPIVIQRQTTTVEPSDLGLSPFPLAKVELAAGILARHRLKIRAAGGLNVPGLEALSVTVVYLFGGGK
jgi:hypothetical protein